MADAPLPEERFLVEANRWLYRAAMVAVVAAGLAGCSSDNKTVTPCPAAKVLSEPSELTRFRDGPGRDPTDVLFKAHMLQVDGQCSYKPGGGDINIELNVVMEVERGPALTGGKVDFGYFVAVTEWTADSGSEPTVRNRKGFKVETQIPEGRRGVRYRDVLDITIPRSGNKDVRNYELFLGFELTKDELSYNKKKLGY